MRNLLMVGSLGVLLATGCASTTVIDFENLSSVTTASPTPTPVHPGDTFVVGDVLIENDTGTRIMVVPFQWGNGIWTSGGNVEIVSSSMAGGSGNEVKFDNVCLGVVAPSPTTIKKVKLKFGEYGGNINLLENGNLHNYGDYFQIPSPTVSGVTVTATNPAVGPKGTLIVEGDLNPFTYAFPGPALPEFTAVVGGGQELWIDDLEFTE